MPLAAPGDDCDAHEPTRYACDVSDDLGTPALRLEREGPIAWCTIDRPHARNALTPAMYFGIKKAVRLVNTDKDSPR